MTGEDLHEAMADMESDFNTGRKDALSSGVKIRAKVKRGTDTRDQDEMLVEARGEDHHEAAIEFSKALARLEDYQVPQRLRSLRADGEGSE